MRAAGHHAQSEFLRSMMRDSVRLTEAQHLQAQLRFSMVLLSLAVISDLIDPALLLVTSTDSLIVRAVEAVGPGAAAVGRVFLVLSALLVPFIALQFGLFTRRSRGITQLACLALTLVGLIWALLTWQALHANVAVVPLIFARNAGGSLLFALALGLSLNREQIRNLMERA